MGRLTGFLGAIILLIVLSPAMAFVTLAIRIDSRGPAIFKQKRVGKDNNYFTLYKYRTMHIDTPDLPSSMVPSDDPRFTRLGKVLRRFSLDELPQLINIIKGDMCFVGPRPALYNQYDLISMREEAGVHKLKPGVTGWAQVNGRDNIALEKKVELDKFYLENKSVFFDLRILWLTFVKSVGGDDLYGEVSSQNKNRSI